MFVYGFVAFLSSYDHAEYRVDDVYVYFYLMHDIPFDKKKKKRLRGFLICASGDTGRDWRNNFSFWLKHWQQIILYVKLI